MIISSRLPVEPELNFPITWMDFDVSRWFKSLFEIKHKLFVWALIKQSHNERRTCTESFWPYPLFHLIQTTLLEFERFRGSAKSPINCSLGKLIRERKFKVLTYKLIQVIQSSSIIFQVSSIKLKILKQKVL